MNHKRPKSTILVTHDQHHSQNLYLKLNLKHILKNENIDTGIISLCAEINFEAVLLLVCN